MNNHTKFFNFITEASSNLLSVNIEELDFNIEIILKFVAELSEIERGYIFLFSEDKETLKLSYEYCKEGVPVHKNVLDLIRVSEFKGFVEELESGKNIKVNLSDLPITEETKQMRDILNLLEIKSFINIPMFVANEMIGYIGFDSTSNEMDWEEETITYFKVCGNIISSALVRKKTEEELEKQKKFYEEKLNLFNLIINNAPDMLWAKDLSGKFIIVNNSICKNLLDAEDSEEPIGKTDMFFADRLRAKKPDDPNYFTFGEICVDSDEIVLKNQKSQRFDEFGNVKGEFLFLDVFKSPLWNKQGQIIGTVGNGRIVTKEREIEAKLKESEKRYRLLAESSTDVISLLDFDFNYVFVSPSVKDLLGYSENELVSDENLKLRNILTESSYNSVVSIHSSRKDDSEILKFDVEFIKKDGSLLIAENISKIIFDETINQKLILVNTRDISDRKNAEESILKLKAAIEQSAQTILITDVFGNIEYVNGVVEKITGYNKNELIGQNTRLFNSGFQSKEYYQNLWDVILGGKNWSGEFLNKKKNGELFWESVIISPNINESGNIVNFVAIKEDITDKKHLLQQLEEAKEKAELSNKLKSMFLAQISHEIRSPINVILNFVSLLKDETAELISPDVADSYDYIDSASRRIIRTIDLILNVSEIQLGSYEPTFKEFDIVTKVLNPLYKEFLSSARGKNLIFNMDNQFENCFVYGDDYSVIQIFANLIDNAIKYTKKGFVTIRLIKENSYAIVEIEDSGIGMSKEYLEEIFTPFSQEEMGYTRKFEGTGLGLSLVKNYCDINKAKITVESKKGNGTKFAVKFKLYNV